jgi:hypothetical protein
MYVMSIHHNHFPQTKDSIRKGPKGFPKQDVKSNCEQQFYFEEPSNQKTLTLWNSSQPSGHHLTTSQGHILMQK